MLCYGMHRTQTVSSWNYDAKCNRGKNGIVWIPWQTGLPERRNLKPYILQSEQERTLRIRNHQSELLHRNSRGDRSHLMLNLIVLWLSATFLSYHLTIGHIKIIKITYSFRLFERIKWLFRCDFFCSCNRYAKRVAYIHCDRITTRFDDCILRRIKRKIAKTTTEDRVWKRSVQYSHRATETIGQNNRPQPSVQYKNKRNYPYMANQNLEVLIVAVPCAEQLETSHSRSTSYTTITLA